MPEMPEIETIKLGLQKRLAGKTIEDIQIKIPKMFIGNKNDVIGAKITGLKRIGKGLVIELDNDFVLAIHLKMTGQLVYQDEKTKNLALSPKIGGAKLPSKYSHIIFTLDNKAFLYYNDLRQFGWIKVVRKSKLMQIPFFKEMGPEPSVAKVSSIKYKALSIPRKELNYEVFKNIVKSANRPIKIVLMDQKKIGGIGNIYANDALFKAKIDPRRSAKQISPKELRKLFDSILFVLKQGLKYGGSSDENFVNAQGQEGNYQNHALVYGREGEKCRVCKTPIEKIFLGGRGTYLCPACQR